MVQFRHENNLLKLLGELTIYQTQEAKRLFKEELDRAESLEVDLSGVEELDSAGAQLLLWVKWEGRSRGRAVTYVRHSPAVLEVFDQLNLAGAFGDTILIAPSS